MEKAIVTGDRNEKIINKLKTIFEFWLTLRIQVFLNHIRIWSKRSAGISKLNY